MNNTLYAEWLTVADVARELGITYSAARYHVYRRNLGAQISSHRVISRPELEHLARILSLDTKERPR